ncbi:MAG TPA: hypothetical protein VF516_06890, partial [Kofleriaceae bacterium]
MSSDRSAGPEPGSAIDHPGGAAPRLAAFERRALESPPPRAEKWLFGPLFGGFLAALVLLGVSHAAAFFVWAGASAATVVIGIR